MTEEEILPSNRPGHYIDKTITSGPYAKISQSEGITETQNEEIHAINSIPIALPHIFKVSISLV